MGLFRKRRAQADFAAEIETHIAAEADRLRDEGMSALDAERAARRKFGNVLCAQERFYETGRILWFEDLRKDVRQALRLFRKSPAVSVTIALVLALGIGSTTAVFSIVDAVLLRASPYPSPDRLVRIEERSAGDAPSSDVSIADYQRWAKRKDIFEEVAPYSRDIVTLTGNGEPEQITALRSLRLFQVLGVPARLGRTLLASDDEHGIQNVAVLSDRLWRRRYHADPTILGHEITVSAEAYTIVGVMPADFEFRYPEAELWTPLRLAVTSPWPQVVARLRAGVSVRQAQNAMEIVAHQMQREKPKERVGFKITVTRWNDLPDQKYKLTLIFVFAAIGLVMSIACVDVGALLLSRAVQRQKEIAIRASLGAGLSRIVRQLLTESLVLTVFGSLGGILVARWLMDFLAKQLAALPIVLPHLHLIGLDRRVLVFNTTLCLLLAGLCSLAPILLAVRIDLQAVFRGGYAAEGSRGSSRLFSTLIGLEAALAFLLLVGSGLMIRSLVLLQQTDHGFRPDHVLTVRVPVATRTQPRPIGKYDTRPQQMAYYREILNRVKMLPGIKAAAIVNNLPLSGVSTSLTFDLGDAGNDSSARTISPEYFAVMGIPLIAGRTFTDSDQTGAPDVAIINQYLARRLFPNRNPLGEKLKEGSRPGPTIVGVVKDSAQTSYELPPKAEVYIPYQQFIFATFMATVAVRTEGEPRALAAALEKQVWAVDSNQPVVSVETMEEVIAASIWRPRFSAWIFSVLSGLSVLLTALGIYGVVAYTSNLRAHEVGIRMALGATANNVLALIMRGAMIPLLFGVSLSVVAALLLSRLLTNLLYGVSSSDPVTYLGAGALLLAIGAIASVRPAWQAAIRDPLQTLRSE
ncbi:MAG: ADOP family duplicated permease [Bryobacteraceae bacterium]